MKNRIALIAGIALAVLLTGTTISSAQDAEKKKGGDRTQMMQQRLDRMSEELKLTEDQKTKVKAAFEAEAKKRQEMRGEGTQTDEQRREAAQKLREEMNKKMKEILTPEQFEKWEKMRAQQGGGKKGEGKGKAEEKKKA
jgi:periplasmic protein CpxP/Spy